MPPSKENQAKTRLTTLQAKIDSFTDAELGDDESLEAYALDIQSFREALKELEDAMVAKIAMTQDNDVITTTSNEYVTLSKTYDKYIAGKAKKLKTLRPPAPAPADETEQEEANPEDVLASKISVIDSCIAAVKTQINNDYDATKALVEDPANLTLTKAKRLSFLKNLDMVKELIESKMLGFYREKAELKPEEASTIMTAYSTARNPLMSNVIDLLHIINTREEQERTISDVDRVAFDQVAHSTPNSTLAYPAGARGTDAALLASTKAMQYMYKTGEPPKFMEPIDYAAYPEFKREWQQLVSVGKSTIWVITNLNRCTTPKVNLDGCTTIQEAWAELDLHFANPMCVSNDLMDTFARYKPEGNDYQRMVSLYDTVSKLYRNLATVKQEGMLTANMYTISQIIRMIPRSYQKEFSKERTKTNITLRTSRGQDADGLDEMTAKETWDILLEFLKAERREIVTYHADEL